MSIDSLERIKLHQVPPFHIGDIKVSSNNALPSTLPLSNIASNPAERIRFLSSLYQRVSSFHQISQSSILQAIPANTPNIVALCAGIVDLDNKKNIIKRIASKISLRWVSEGWRILREVLDWHEDQLRLGWTTGPTHPMNPSHPFEQKTTNVDGCFTLYRSSDTRNGGPEKKKLITNTPEDYIESIFPDSSWELKILSWLQFQVASLPHCDYNVRWISYLEKNPFTLSVVISSNWFPPCPSHWHLWVDLLTIPHFLCLVTAAPGPITSITYRSLSSPHLSNVSPSPTEGLQIFG